MQYTANYQLKKPEDSEVFDQQNHANYNYVIIDQVMKAIEEKAENAPADSVNDDAIGIRTPDQDQVPEAPGTGKLGQLVSWLANRIKAITGKTNWWDAPDKTIQQLADDQAAHKADTMPHKFTDGTTTYRWGLAVIDGVVNMVYEEVV